LPRHSYAFIANLDFLKKDEAGVEAKAAEEKETIAKEVEGE